MAFPTIQSYSSGLANSGSTGPTLPAGIVSGDLILAIFNSEFNALATPSTYTRIGSSKGGTYATQTAFYKVATGSDAITLDYTAGYIIYRITGAGTPTGTFANQTGDPPAHTATAGDNLWIASVAEDNGNSQASSPSNYGNLYTATAQPYYCLGSATRNLNAATENPGLMSSFGEVSASTIAVPPGSPPSGGSSGGGTSTGGGSSGSPVLLTTTGSGTWTVPAGVTSITVECWGGGGRGAGGNGGGGGAYARVNSLAVTAGAALTYYVAPGNGPSNSGSDPTYFGSSASSTAPVCAATGTNRLDKATQNGGQATNSTGDVKYSGGDAPAGNGANGGGGSASKNGNGNPGSGGAGGSSPGGGAGSAAGDPPSPGGSNVEGGGGSGGANFSGFGAPGVPGGGTGSTGNGTNQPGGRGQIRITYATGGASTPAAKKRRSTSLP